MGPNIRWRGEQGEGREKEKVEEEAQGKVVMDTKLVESHIGDTSGI